MVLDHWVARKRAWWIMTGFAALFLAVSIRAAEVSEDKAAAKEGGAEIERGRYLVTVTACGDCHTPMRVGPKGPEPDLSRMLSGHPEALNMPAIPKLPEAPWQWVGAATLTAFAGPWGISYATNLTPDRETGIGNWTKDIFIASMRTGKHAGVGRPVMPPMPWQAYAQLTDQDLKAMFAYLGTLPSVKNRVPDYEPPAPQEGQKGQ